VTPVCSFAPGSEVSSLAAAVVERDRVSARLRNTSTIERMTARRQGVMVLLVGVAAVVAAASVAAASGSAAPPGARPSSALEPLWRAFPLEGRAPRSSPAPAGPAAAAVVPAAVVGRVVGDEPRGPVAAAEPASYVDPVVLKAALVAASLLALGVLAAASRLAARYGRRLVAGPVALQEAGWVIVVVVLGAGIAWVVVSSGR